MKDTKEEIQITIAEEDAGQRLDTFLCSRLDGKSRSQVQKMIRNGEVTIRGKEAKCGHLLNAGTVISVIEEIVPDYRIVPQNIPLDIIYEDRHLVVVNKPAGLTVHPAPGNPDGTLVNALLYHFGELAPTEFPERPGIVHRLDKDTSGLLIAARHPLAHADLTRQFAERKVKKEYLAMLWGKLKNKKDCIRHLIGRSKGDRKKMTVKLKKGKLGITRYEIQKEAPGFSLALVMPATGRTHQIRVHFAYLHHPVVGDRVYGGDLWRGLQDPVKKKAVQEFDRLALHARAISFTHPDTGEKLSFTAPLPEAFLQLQTILGL